MSVARTVAKNSTFFMIANGTDQLITFVIGVLIARHLGPSEYDLYAFLVWFILLTVYFSNLGLGYMVTRFIAETQGQKNETNARNYVSFALWLRIIAAITVTLVVMIFAGFWSDIFGYQENKFLFILISFGILPNVLNFLLSSIFAGFQKYEYGAYVTLISHPARALGVAIVIFLDFGVQEIIVANIASWILGMIVGLLLLRRLIPLKRAFSPPQFTPELKRGAKYAAIMLGILFMNYFLRQRAEVFFLGIFNIDNAVGFYTIAFLIPTSTVGLVLGLLTQVLVPAVSEQFGRGDTNRIKSIYITSTRFLMMVGVPLSIGGICLSQSLIFVLYGTEYSPAIPLMQVMFLPYAILGISDSAVSVILGTNRPTFIFKVGIVLGIISVGMNLWLIPALGTIGAAIASSISRVIAPVIYFRYASKLCEAKWPVRDSIKIVASSLFMGAIVYGLSLHINSPLLSLILLIPLGAIIHATLLLLFGAINKTDVQTFSRAQESLPLFLQKYTTKILSLLTSMVKWRDSLTSSVK